MCIIFSLIYTREKLKKKIIGSNGASGKLINFDTIWAFPLIPFFEIETTWNVLKESKEKINDSLKLQKKLPAFMEEGLNKKEINLNIERHVNIKIL
ncbi:hypothetical protein Mgra_00001836 [Meloidogyne graminicola]|uniref:Uncharacterized protein n=1 Tax=Meloidogyne graminicola TaxID=189291 RepID=A0A8T0A011_9BILA|nr:hypothetical protein Mgra_00001836 [Meloidogyne graminicola]